MEEAKAVTTRLRHLVGSVVLLFDILSTEEPERLLFPDMSNRRNSCSGHFGFFACHSRRSRRLEEAGPDATSVFPRFPYR